MIDQIVSSLRRRTDLIGWTVRRELVHGTQLYAAAGRIEAERQTREERCDLAVVCPTSFPDGAKGCGTGRATILPGEQVEPAIARAVEMASRVHNPLHGLPGPAPLPDVPLQERDLVERPAEQLREAHEHLTTLASAEARVRLTAAEWHAQTIETQLVNSRGQEGSQRETRLGLEWVLVMGEGNDRAEGFRERSLRRLADLAMEQEFESLTRETLDRQQAGAAPAWEGAVVVRDRTLAGYVDSGPIRFLSSAANRYAKLSGWDIGEEVAPKNDQGEPFTAWANRILPYGSQSSRFDEEGIPGQRLLLIKDNHLEALWAPQRYAEYLNVPATGEFGDIEVPPGSRPEAELLTPPYVEIAGFSWFNPDPVTGDFATEIRLGYVVEDGSRRPFRGGLLIGNLLESLGRARWSREAGFFGNYQGPRTGRFEGLKVSGPTTG